MTIEEFIKSLNLPIEFKKSGSEYVAKIESSNDFASIFNTISLNRDLTADDDSVATEDKTMFVYTDGYFEIRLSADYNKDVYSITIGER